MIDNNSHPSTDGPFFENEGSGDDRSSEKDQKQDSGETSERYITAHNNRDQRTIRDIPIGEDRRRQNERRRKMNHRNGYRAHRRSNSMYLLGGVGLIAFVFFAFVGVSLFTKAKITLEPLVERVEPNDSFETSPDINSTDLDALTYEIFTVEETRSTTLEATGEEEVSRPATGQITVYNTYSEEDQPIVSRTRFETEDGRVYRSGDAFVIPGMRENDEPGEVTVTVTATEPGEEYNVEEARFTLPGLEGTELADGFYAEIETPITGGFVGVQKTVREEAEEETRASLREELSSSMKSDMLSELETESLLIENSVFFEYVDRPTESVEEGVSVPVQGTLYAAAVDLEDLAQYIAKENLTSYNGESLSIDKPEEVSIELDQEDDAELTLEVLEKGDLPVSIGGVVVLVWDIDQDALIEQVSGLPKQEALREVSSFPGVASGNLELWPGFMRSLPSSGNKIKVIVTDVTE